MKSLYLIPLCFVCACFSLNAQIGNYLDFDGTDDYVQINDSDDFDFSGDFTIEFSFQRGLEDSRQDLFTKKDLNASPSKNDITISITDTNTIRVFLREDNATNISLEPSITVPLGTWHHVAVTRLGGTVTLYFDGEPKATDTLSTDLTSDGPIRLGANREDNTDANGALTLPFTGAIDEVRIWTVARSQNDINTYKSDELTLPQTNLVTYYQFNQGVAGDDNLSISTLTNTIDCKINKGNLNNFTLTGASSNWLGTLTQRNIIYVYVDANANGNNDGSSWANAFTDLEDALSIQICNAIAEIRVAGNTSYTPRASRNCTSCSSNRDNYFLLEENLQLRGSYIPDTDDDPNNDVQDYSQPTILSGNIGDTSTTDDNTHHVLIALGLNQATIINGFTITQGNANADGSIHINGVEIFRRDAGGMMNYDSSNTLSHLQFIDNTATTGGGLYNHFNAPRIKNCVFYKNSAGNGGGMHNQGSSPSVLNSLYAENSNNGVFNFVSSASYTNCTFYGNDQHGMFNQNVGDLLLYNNVFYNNSTDIAGENVASASSNNASDQGGAGLSGTTDYTALSADPFINSTNPIGADAIWGTADDGLKLIGCSSLIDAGDNSQNSTMTDIAGNTRIQLSTIDIGAYEASNQILNTAITYVDANATGTNDGSSWANAFTYVETALALQDCGFTGEIRVAGNTTYTPSTSRGCTDCSGERDYYFLLTNNIQLKGSYIPDADNDPSNDVQDYNQPTILSGDLMENDVINTDADGNPLFENYEDNTYHVMLTNGLSSAAHIDGFSFRRGNASGGGSISITGFSSSIDYLWGGGIVNLNSHFRMSNCSFTSNSASVGGGMYNVESNPSITNSTFSRNSTFNGGAMYNLSSDPSITNCSFSDNDADNDGGAMYNEGSSSPQITNSIIWGNSSSIFNTSSSSNPSISFSIIQGSGGSGSNNSDANPLFVSNTDLRLQAGSPAIDAGNNDAISQDITTDLAGNPRIAGSTVDVGAYEFISCANTTLVYVDASATGTNDGSSWANAFTHLENALDLQDCGFTGEIRVAGNTTYTPSASRGCTNCSGNNDRDYYFLINKNLQLKGSYVPDTDDDPSNDVQDYSQPTILSGDVGNTGNTSNNSYHIMLTDALSSAAVVDGFNFSGGNANGSGTFGFSVNSFIPKFNGGGMYNLNSRLSISNSTFSGNSAAASNSQVSGNGGAMYNNESSPSITNSTFSGNTTNRDGGAIYNFLTSSPSISHSSFSGNRARDGGAMYNFILSSPNITNSTFSGNNAAKGGAMYNVRSRPSITNSSFSDNRANVAGGAMYNDDSNPSISHSSFSGRNRAKEGGAIYNTLSSSPSITNSTFFSNFADEGGAMFNLDSSNPSITNSTFSNNEAFVDHGGAMYNRNSSPSITNCSFSNNETHNRNGGAMYNMSSSPSITNCSFSDNDANNSGGAMYNIDSSNPSITNSSFSRNRGNNGGGMYNRSSSPSISNCSYTSNSGSSGGGMYNTFSSRPSITNSTFSGNNATNGGAMYNLNSSPSITNSIFSGNRANEDGGAMYNVFSSSPSISNSIIWNNTADDLTSSTSASIFNNDSGGTSTPNISFSIIANSGGSGSWVSDIGDDGGNNLDTDPLFVSESNLRLQAGSPAIDAGNNAAIPNGITTDLAGNPRIQGDIVDMGAYEFAAQSISVLGNDTAISNGASTTSTTDGTNFGTVGTLSPLSQRYTISNTGSASLNLTGTPLVATSGSTSFAISQQPATTSILGGETTSFTVTFTADCALLGVQTATISIASEDANNNPFTFTITATATDDTPPTFTGTLPALQETRGFTSGNTYSLEDFISLGAIGMADNCSASRQSRSFTSGVSQNPEAGTLLGEGMHTITITATDNAGNTTDYVFALTVSATLSTNPIENDSNSIVLYPNPTRQMVYIEGIKSPTQAALYNLLGQHLADYSFSKQKETLDVSGFANGVYILKIGDTALRIVKE